MREPVTASTREGACPRPTRRRRSAGRSKGSASSTSQQVAHIDLPSFRGEHPKHLSRTGGSFAQCLAGVGHRPAPEGPDVEWAQIRIAQHDLYIVEPCNQFFRDQHAEGGGVVLTDVDLAAERGHHPRRREVQPRAAAHRPPGRLWRPDDDQTVAEKVEPVSLIGLAQVPRSSGRRQ